jgi:fatty-acid desaturase
MKQTHLSLVPTATDAAGTTTEPIPPRKPFWHAFLDWMAVATTQEQEQLEAVLALHSHEVRPLVDAMTDALAQEADAMRIPPTLLANLVASGWTPVPRHRKHRQARA